MTDTAALRALLTAATPGPWTTTPVSRWRVAALDLAAGTEHTVADCSVNRADDDAENDAALIAAAVNALPALLDKADALAALVAALEAHRAGVPFDLATEDALAAAREKVEGS